MIDKSGVVFFAKSHVQYPVITFSSYSNDVVNAVAQFVQSLPGDLLSNIESIAIASPQFIQSKHRGLGSGNLIVRWGNNQDLPVKVKVLRTLLALPENAKVKLLDLSSPLSPIAK